MSIYSEEEYYKQLCQEHRPREAKNLVFKGCSYVNKHVRADSYSGNARTTLARSEAFNRYKHIMNVSQDSRRKRPPSEKKVVSELFDGDEDVAYYYSDVRKPAKLVPEEGANKERGAHRVPTPAILRNKRVAAGKQRVSIGEQRAAMSAEKAALWK